MTSPRPPLYDDGGALPDTRVDDDRPARAPAPGPNYLVRRAIAVGAVVAAIALVAVVVGRIISAEGDDGAATPSTADWNTVVVLVDDAVRLVDPGTGDVNETFPGDEPLLDVASLVSGDKLVLLNDFGRITELDLTDGSIRRSSAPDESVLVRSSENASIVLAGPPLGGEIAVVDTAARATIAIGRVAGLGDPLIFVDQVLVNRAGTHVATSDARTFQSVLVDVSGRTAVLLAGQVVALDDTAVITAQRAGERAELEFYDLAGERRGQVDAPSPAATMLTGESTALIIAGDGTIATVTSGGSVGEIGSVAEDGPVEVRGGTPASDSTRLVVTTAGEVVVIDDAGTVRGRAAGDLLWRVGRESRCAVIGSARTNGTAFHVDLDSGETLGEFPGGIVSSASADGCTVSMLGDEQRIIARGTDLEVEIDSGSLSVTPDGSAYLLTTFTGEELVSLDADDDAEPVELADEPALTRFAEL